MTPTPMAATATATKPEADDFLPTSSATPSLPYSSPALSHSALLPEWGTRQAAEAAATRHHHHQHSRHNSQRAGPVATCNISSKAAAARLPLPSSPLSLLSVTISLSIALLPQRSSCIFFSRIEFGMLSTQMRLCRRGRSRPQLQQQWQWLQSLQQQQHMWHATDASQPKVVAIFGNNSSSITLASVAASFGCLLLLPHNGDVFVFAFAIS